ncbi:methyltransferase domain-containing protein [Corallincola holothuriorum]|uniref:Methyltransferase domain-containing protein n=1 Tax=Corallincola holothuriorum TaxID=2282215 RepID=A0A368NIG0_9GAMM|nr:class I SAM-dependent methyltransferase [Corallincola holothuriorum]RCU50377.1 methyltransferase domain-containing protein [Corallincola holothuriorum]
MITRFNRVTVAALLTSVSLGFSANVLADETTPAGYEKLQEIADDSRRSEKNRARNQYRHPVETLAFFGLKPDMTVVELWPGGGWYTEILAPYLKDKGQLIAASFQIDGIDEDNRRQAYRAKVGKAYREKLDTNAEWWGGVKETTLAPPATLSIAPANSADMVLTFRNLHNWEMNGELEMVFKAAFDALKPGGVFGVVEHRSAPAEDDKARAKSGYVSQERTIAAAQKAGFVLVDQSEVNANPADIKDYPKGVWTLPPSLAMGDEDRAKYEAIGESDRMTLKFVKQP